MDSSRNKDVRRSHVRSGFGEVPAKNMMLCVPLRVLRVRCGVGLCGVVGAFAARSVWLSCQPRGYWA